MLGVLVMLSNFLHDLAVALFACGALGLAALWRSALRADVAARPVIDALDRLGQRILGWTLLAVAAFGAIRGLAFERFEYNPAVGRGQVPALMVKHLLLAGLLVAALVTAALARRRARVARAQEAGGRGNAFPPAHEAGGRGNAFPPAHEAGR